MKNYKIYTTILLALSFSACSTTSSDTQTKPSTSVHTGGIKPCTKEYVPVCAEVQVECIAAPCKPIKKTFPNMCVMQNSKNAKFLYKGFCK